LLILFSSVFVEADGGNLNHRDCFRRVGFAGGFLQPQVDVILSRTEVFNGNGRENQGDASLAITVLPRWWATWWFHGGTIVVLIVMVCGLFRFREGARRKRIMHLESEAKNRDELNRKLALSEQRFLSFITNSSEQMWCVEFDEPIPLDLPEEEQVERILSHGYYVEANEAFAATYGASVNEVIGWKLERTLPRSLPATYSFLYEAVGARFRMIDAESHEIAKDGSERFILNSMIPAIEDNRVLRVWGTARDISVRKQITEELRVASEFNNVVLDSMDAQIVILDRAGIIIDQNSAWEEFADANGGIASETCLGTNYLETCQLAVSAGDATARKALQGLRRVLEGTIESFELEYPCDSPTERRWFVLRAVPLKTSDGGLVVSHMNITELKQAEQELSQQRDQLEHVSRAATLVEIGAALAHELNQPLAAILRNAQAARRFVDAETPDLAEIRETLDDIVKDNRRAGKVLDRIREQLSRNISERMSVCLNDVIGDALALLHSDLIIRKALIDLQLSPKLPPVFADPVQLQQVILNLVINAEDAMEGMPASESRIVISTTCDQNRVKVSVSDSGKGIPKRQLEKVFEPFHTTKEGGMGVGLAINRTIIESHDGRMWAENLSQGGARLVFSLPVLTEQDEQDDELEQID
tara:strand:- start:20020 stop:21957 length:1938 start_codon:yes stop_codon:yes gene_type:complete